MFRISTSAVSWECSCSVLLLVKFGEILGIMQAHFKCSKFCGFPGMCLQCPQNFPKFSQKQYTAGTLPGHCKCTDLEHLWYITLVCFKFSEPGTHWGKVVVFPPGTLQVHHKEKDSVPAMNPPGTLQIHFKFPTQFTTDDPSWDMHGTLTVFQLM